MKDLTPLEKEFIKDNPPTNYDLQALVNRIWQRAYLDTPEECGRQIIEYAAKACAALCERKMREAIELATCLKRFEKCGYTEQEIIDKLSNPK